MPRDYLTDLPVELHLEIYSYLSPRDLRNLRFVNRQNNAVVTPTVFKTVAIDPKDPDLAQLVLLLKFTKKLVLLPLIRYTGYNGKIIQPVAAVENFLRIVWPSMINLEAITILKRYEECPLEIVRGKRYVNYVVARVPTMI